MLCRETAHQQRPVSDVSQAGLQCHAPSLLLQVKAKCMGSAKMLMCKHYPAGKPRLKQDCHETLTWLHLSGWNLSGSSQLAATFCTACMGIQTSTPLGTNSLPPPIHMSLSRFLRVVPEPTTGNNRMLSCITEMQTWNQYHMLSSMAVHYTLLVCAA